MFNLRKQLSGAVIGFLIFSTPAMANLPSVGFADLVEQKAPAVVVIKAEQTVFNSREPGMLLPPFMRDNPGIPPEILDQLEQFMQRGVPGVPGQGSPDPVAGIGTGFFISEDGYIVTNHHVIEKADKITVEFSDGREIEAELIGSDPKTDLAVLDIDGSGYSYLNFGNSDIMRVGDVVLAIGAPFGLSGSVSAGIVSAIGREIGSGPYDNFIQTDAAINKGNSGGPLMNVEGDVIGVNTAIFSNSGGSIGIGFAIPASLAEKVVDDLLSKGSVERGWLGVQIQPITEQIAKAFNISSKEGVLVGDVFKDSPAFKSGFEIGDIILSFDGKKIKKLSDLPRFVADTPVGKLVPIQIFREQTVITLDVNVEKLQDEVSVSAKVSESLFPSLAEFGVSLKQVEEKIYIDDVTLGSRAESYGLEVGDQILRLGSLSDLTIQVLEDSLAMNKVSIIQVLKTNGEIQFLAFK